MNEIQGIGVSSVTRTVTVRAPIERSFEVFTAGFDRWWPRTHHAGRGEMETIVIEPRAGGRWYERSVDGTEHEWGRVLEWQPPHRIVLEWHLGAGFEYVDDPARATEVEARFSAVGPETTRVEVEHRKLDPGGDAARLIYAISDENGWSTLLARYADKIDW